MEAINEQSITSFLLGELSEDERQNIEERVFTDDRFYEQVRALQEDLADDYVQNRLSPKQMTRFEEYFLQSPRRRERVQFAAALSGALAPAEPGTAPAIVSRGLTWWESLAAFVRPRAALAMSLASLLILLLGGTWFYLQNRRLQTQVAQAGTQSAEAIHQAQVREAAAERRRQELEQETKALRAQGTMLQSKIEEKEHELAVLQNERTAATKTPAGFVASFTLLPGLTRDTRESNEPEKLIIPAAAQFVQLRLGLEHEEDYQGYFAEIRTARGNLVWSKSGLMSQRSASGQVVLLTLPNKLLTNGEYEVTLKGASQGQLKALGYYYFISLNR